MGFLPRLARPTSWIAVGAGAFSVATLIVFRMVGWSLLIALVVLLIIALIAVIWMLVRQLRSTRASEEIESTIVRQADRDIERSGVGRSAKAESEKAALLAALKNLKGSTARIPWYMLLGPAEAGKSTLVERSGLHFALTDRARKPSALPGVGGTRSLEWWLSEEAVFLEMPGHRLTTAGLENNEEWIDFLATLKRQRGPKPLNGVIVMVGLDHLARCNETELDTLARRHRDRIRDLMKRLGVVFPTYVVFTGADHLAGFADFFADLDASQRREPWGAAIAIRRALDQAPEELFDAEFDALQASLSERRLRRVASLSDPEQRARAFAFPLQLEGLRGQLRRFLKGLFAPSPAEESPLFRGFYLASIETGGEVVDRVIEPAARTLGLAAGKPPVATLRGEGGCFAQDLLNRVVIPDANLAAISSSEEARRRRRQAVVLAAVGVLFLACAIVLSSLSCMNQRVVNRTREAAQTVEEQVRPGRALYSNLRFLEALRGRMELVDSLSRGARWYRRLGGYSGSRLREPAINLYVDKALETVIGPGVRGMEDSLRRWTDSETGDFLRYYHYYRSWRLLTDINHLADTDAPIVGEVLSEVLSSEMAASPASERDSLPGLVELQVRSLGIHHLAMARRPGSHDLTGDRSLAERAAARLRATWDPNPFYRRMIDQVRRLTPEVDFQKLAGSAAILSGTYQVPGPFTRDGWQKHVGPRTESCARHVAEDWIIGTIFDESRPALADSLRQFYARDYSRHWVSFLRSVGTPKASTYSAAESKLKLLAENDSELFKLLKGVAHHTRLEANATSPMGQVAGSFALADLGAEPGGQRQAWWRDIMNRIARKPKGAEMQVNPQESPRNNYLKLLRGLQEKVVLAAQPGVGDKPIRDLSIRSPDNPSPPIPMLRDYCDQLAEMVGGEGSKATSRVLKLPAKIVDGLDPDSGSPIHVGGRMPSEVNGKWKILVVGPFRETLRGKYPLTSSGANAKLEDFARFFRPGGTFWQFYDASLKEYVSENGAPTSQEAAAYVSSGLRTAVAKAAEIREAFFGGGGQMPAFNFNVRTTQPVPSGVPQANWTALHLHGQTLDYQMGHTAWKAMSWPGPNPSAGAEIRVNVSGFAAGPKYGGEWGLFRLMDRGKPSTSAEGNPQYYIVIPVGAGGLGVTYEFRGEASQKLFEQGFMRFVLPEDI